MPALAFPRAIAEIDATWARSRVDVLWRKFWSPSSSPLTDHGAQPGVLAERAVNLWARFLAAVATERTGVDHIPNGMTPVLVPTDDSALAHHEIALGQSVLGQGADV